MTQDQYEERDRLGAEQARLIKQMDGVRDHFVSQVAEELPDRWEGVVRLWISNRSVEAKQLGEAGLREIRAEVESLVPHTHDIARKYLSGEKVWLHERSGAVFPSGGRPQYQPTGSGGTKIWSHVSEPLMQAEDEVVPILKEHFAGHVNRRGWDGAPLSDALIEIIQTYADLHQDLKEVSSQLEDLNRQIDSAEALSIWDSVKDEQ